MAENKIDYLKRLMGDWNSAIGKENLSPRATALDSEDLGYIGRPIDQMTEEEKDALYAPISQPVTIPENIIPSAEPPEEVSSQEEKMAFIEKPKDFEIPVAELPMQEPTALTYKDIMGKDKQLPPKSEYEKLIDEYKQAQETYKTDLQKAYDVDRKATLMQNVIEGLGKAFIYNKYAKVGGPIDLGFKPLDFKYAEQVKEASKNKLDTYKELISQLKTNQANKVKSEIQDFGDKKILITYDNEGTIQKTQDLGKKAISEYQQKLIDQRELFEGAKGGRFSESMEYKKFEQERKKEEKLTDDARNALKDMRQKESWKSGEKTLSEIPNLKILLDDAYTKGGQSLSMLGPKIAKAIAGEVGVLTDQDVTRYIQNPALVPGLKDTLEKAKSGRLTEASYDNLIRLMNISEQAAKDKINKTIDEEAKLFSRRKGIDYNEAKSYLDVEYAGMPQEQKKVFSQPQEKSIELIMEKKSVDRDTAIKLLQDAGRLPK